MLKITVTDSATEQKWILCGRLTEPWVSEVWSHWTKTRNERQGRQCVVDVDDLIFIDQSGEAILLAMMNENVQFVARGVYTKQLLEDLRDQTKWQLRKCVD